VSVWLTDEGSGIVLDVLEVHDDGLTVRGKSGTFRISPPSPEAVSLFVEAGDPIGLVRAAEAGGYATEGMLDIQGE
jgi:hypothetical protein